MQETCHMNPIQTLKTHVVSRLQSNFIPVVHKPAKLNFALNLRQHQVNYTTMLT